MKFHADERFPFWEEFKDTEEAYRKGSLVFPEFYSEVSEEDGKRYLQALREFEKISAEVFK